MDIDRLVQCKDYLDSIGIAYPDMADANQIQTIFEINQIEMPTPIIQKKGCEGCKVEKQSNETTTKGKETPEQRRERMVAQMARAREARKKVSNS